MKTSFFIVMGVSGSGKTDVGKSLAEHLGWVFYDADDFHPPENVVKMARGIPLTDSDRAPWLDSLHDLISSSLKKIDLVCWHAPCSRNDIVSNCWKAMTM